MTRRPQSDRPKRAREEEERLEDARRREAREQRFAAKEAKSREKLAAIEWRIAWLARPSVLCETPAETRARLEADAERVWGSNWRDKACMDTDHWGHVSHTRTASS